MHALRTGLPPQWYIREIFGILLVAVLCLRAARAVREEVVQGVFEKLGPPRYYVMMFLLLMMMSLPIKNAGSLAVQPEVHRGNPGILLQHLTYG